MSTRTPLPIAADIAAAAEHGSYCPKMCTFACPVAAATGRDDAVPWSFHREVSDLAQGRTTPQQVGERLDLCNGCLACQDACTYEQDIPSQVVAARTAVVDAGVVSPKLQKAIDRVALSSSPFGVDVPSQPPSDATAQTVIVIGCRDLEASLQALSRLALAANQPIRFAQPEGCCGGVLRSMGATGAADGARTRLAGRVVQAETLVAMDESCLPVMPVAIDVVTWLYRLVGQGSLRLQGKVGPVTFHDPARLARVHGMDHAPRALLRAVGARVLEPEGHGRQTVSAGPGLGMELLQPEAAAAVATRRAEQLASTGVPVVTVGGPSLHALRSAGLDVLDLLEVLAQNLEG